MCTSKLFKLCISSYIFTLILFVWQPKVWIKYKNVRIQLKLNNLSSVSITLILGGSISHFPTFCSLPNIPVHLPWIHCLHWLHSILFEPTPFLQTPHSHFPEFSVGPNFASHFIAFVLPKFTCAYSPYSLFHLWIFSTSSSSVSAFKTISVL